MYCCVECGVRLPPRAKGGHREREYCSSRCRQRAYRKQKKERLQLEQLIGGSYAIPTSDTHETRDRWRFERAGLLQRCKLLEAERNTAQAEATFLQHRNDSLEENLRGMHVLLESKEEEIIRLTVLLDSQSKRKR